VVGWGGWESRLKQVGGELAVRMIREQVEAVTYWSVRRQFWDFLIPHQGVGER
jgi:hypothetical protein